MVDNQNLNYIVIEKKKKEEPNNENNEQVTIISFTSLKILLEDNKKKFEKIYEFKEFKKEAYQGNNESKIEIKIDSPALGPPQGEAGNAVMKYINLSEYLDNNYKNIKLLLKNNNIQSKEKLISLNEKMIIIEIKDNNGFYKKKIFHLIILKKKIQIIFLIIHQILN